MARAPSTRIIKAHWDPEIVKNVHMMGQTYAERIQSFFNKYANLVAGGISVTFAEAAAKYTPPNIGKANIEQKYYFRPVQDLTLLVKGEYPPYHATRQDYAALREGFKFRVLNTKVGHKKNEVYAYTKGINEAKRASRIQNRGLSKYSWGALINNYNEKIQRRVATGKVYATANQLNIYKVSPLPHIFTRLATKSPNITRYDWGVIDWNTTPDSGDVKNINITVENRLTEIQKYGQIALRQGAKAGINWFRKVAKALDISAQYKGHVGGPINRFDAAARQCRVQLVNMFNNLHLEKLNFKALTQSQLKHRYTIHVTK